MGRFGRFSPRCFIGTRYMWLIVRSLYEVQPCIIASAVAQERAIFWKVLSPGLPMLPCNYEGYPANHINGPLQRRTPELMPAKAFIWQGAICVIGWNDMHANVHRHRTSWTMIYKYLTAFSKPVLNTRASIWTIRFSPSKILLKHNQERYSFVNQARALGGKVPPTS